MNKSLRKLITLSSSALLLAGVGASATTATSSVHASRVSRLESRRARDYRDINSINRQLSKLTHKHIRRHARRNVRKHTVRRHHSAKKLSVGEWYVRNAKKLDDHFGGDEGSSEMYNSGRDDATYGDYDIAGINPRNYRNLTYRRGWIITYANNGDSGATPSETNGGDYNSYTNANHTYNEGVAHIRANHNRSMIYYHQESNTWDTDND